MRRRNESQERANNRFSLFPGEKRDIPRPRRSSKDQKGKTPPQILTTKDQILTTKDKEPIKEVKEEVEIIKIDLGGVKVEMKEMKKQMKEMKKQMRKDKKEVKEEIIQLKANFDWKFSFLFKELTKVKDILISFKEKLKDLKHRSPRKKRSSTQVPHAQRQKKSPKKKTSSNKKSSKKKRGLSIINSTQYKFALYDSPAKFSRYTISSSGKKSRKSKTPAINWEGEIYKHSK